jgi:hypothetical protein
MAKCYFFKPLLGPAILQSSKLSSKYIDSYDKLCKIGKTRKKKLSECFLVTLCVLCEEVIVICYKEMIHWKQEGGLIKGFTKKTFK